MTNTGVSDFLVLPLKFSESSSSYHELFIKEHVTRHQSAETPAGCTLFILNVPPYATKESLARIFRVAGPVQNVIIKKQAQQDQLGTGGFKMAYVVFLMPLHVQHALKLTKLECLSTPETPVMCGMSRWTDQYNQSIPNLKDLKEDINAFMLQFDKKTEDLKKKETAGEDEEGWTMVTKHGRRPGFSRKEAVTEKIKAKMEKKKKELTNFYTFQIRDSKMKHLAGLRQKFEEDKKKIAVLKRTRKFKPL